VIQYWFERHRELQRQRSEGGFEGFTLIELLIVIVVLGILAATVILALGGVTGQSARAACNSDAKSYEEAISAFENAPTNTTNAPPANVAAMVPNYLHAKSDNVHFVVLLGDGATGDKNGNTPDSGTVLVGPPGAGIATSWEYDSQTNVAATGGPFANPCDDTGIVS
jgi:prepilin-type N-terminal cleavage/methylation domain-containing protein